MYTLYSLYKTLIVEMENLQQKFENKCQSFVQLEKYQENQTDENSGEEYAKWAKNELCICEETYKYKYYAYYAVKKLLTENNFKFKSNIFSEIFEIQTTSSNLLKVLNFINTIVNEFNYKLSKNTPQTYTLYIFL